MYSAFRRGIPEELDAIAQNKKEKEIVNIVINEQEKILYTSLDKQASEQEMKEIKYKLYEIEKSRALKKAAEEVEKKFLGKPSDEL